ncbi:MAG TPA: hypothetical protein VNA20_14170 [Frankiaceae bacterium]|nr:hypothetical protein [Frankiaceae bacterium]
MTRHPYRVAGALVAVMIVSITVSALVGQRGDGPWESGPMWLGTLGYAIFMIALLALVAYAAVTVFQRRGRTAR